jgi:CBS domain-containing protein
MVRAHYSPLPQTRLAADAGFHSQDPTTSIRVRADSPAVEVMTDLRRVSAATISVDTPINQANQAMMHRGVRSLIVTDGQRVLGIVTATDVLGEKPMQVVLHRGIRHAEIVVRDIMTPADRLDVIELDDVLHAEVGHVVASLKQSGRQHALVVDSDDAGRQMIRGIFSATQIARQLGIVLHTPEVARTFAEIGAAVGL